MAVLIALSLAVMPAAAAGMPAAMPGANSGAHTMMSGDMPEGCHHHHAVLGDDGAKPVDDGAAMAPCCGNLFNYIAMAIPSITPTPTASSVQPVAASDVVLSTTGSPPFRPPRV